MESKGHQEQLVQGLLGGWGRGRESLAGAGKAEERKGT